jgi:hypothetical protein
LADARLKIGWSVENLDGSGAYRFWSSSRALEDHSNEIHHQFMFFNSFTTVMTQPVLVDVAPVAYYLLHPPLTLSICDVWITIAKS